ncbi:MAG: HEPN domain-containing protein [Euryarchaeota archaeon]|nr:HEPN domain-containing protein [Euryarchaeota archaeon]
MHEKYLAKAAEELSAAKYLFDGNYFDAATGKAYYSMYNAAKALLSLRKIHPKRHGGVIAKFGLEFVKKGFIEDTYGQALAHAKDRREIADYDIDKRITKESAEATIDDAERFLERVKEVIEELSK